MEALAISYITLGIIFITVFSFKRYKATTGKSFPKRLKSTFIPHANLSAFEDKKSIKQVFEL
ncbi:MAG: hypothetical protein CMB80_19805 [Flammeovirgaceae bacterium]|nr:hypothetical protein [Flammeovirgaceae bacterium]MBE61225.1 hypothetical protein [Flammeovirgaceae bacterium]MBR10379.1 hypothetical protein [Rickettsiales bacterium]